MSQMAVKESQAVSAAQSTAVVKYARHDWIEF